MPTPTKNALAKHPRAVVILDFPVASPGEYVMDFEWFDTEQGQKTWLAELQTWAAEDVTTVMDTHHLIVEVTDTGVPPTVESVSFYAVGNGGRNQADPAEIEKEWREKIDADPTSIIFVPPKKETEPAKRVRPAVRGRKPSPAKEGIKKATDAAKVPPAEDKADALKKRLAARKAEAKDAPKPEATNALTVPPKPKRVRRPANKVQKEG